ncbi:MAG: hypothetical protein MK213_06000, partial [Planctomycetes bacterium]|nr:hypothetical protein [Planctomycetota bacterium]
LVLVVGAEIFPKVLAHRNPTRTGAWLLPPIRGLDFVFGRATRWLNQKMIRPRTPNSLTAQELRNLIRSEGANLLPDGEGDLLHRLLELDVLRAGAVRRPLADTPRVRGAVSLDLARQRLRERGVAWAAVEDAQSEIVGILDFGRLPEGDRVMDAMHPVPILPEVAPLARGVFLLRETGAPFVLLVDEYGSGAGVLERGRWADTLLDRASAAVSAGDGHRAIRRMSENRFAIDAGLPLHVFAKKFGDLGSVDPKVDTLAGWMSEKLAKVPEKGNRLMWRLNDTAVEFLVTQSQGARPSEIQVTFSTGSWNLPPEGGEA